MVTGAGPRSRAEVSVEFAAGKGSAQSAVTDPNTSVAAARKRLTWRIARYLLFKSTPKDEADMFSTRGDVPGRDSQVPAKTYLTRHPNAIVQTRLFGAKLFNMCPGTFARGAVAWLSCLNLSHAARNYNWREIAAILFCRWALRAHVFLCTVAKGAQTSGSWVDKLPTCRS